MKSEVDDFDVAQSMRIAKAEAARRCPANCPSDTRDELVCEMLLERLEQIARGIPRASYKAWRYIALTALRAVFGDERSPANGAVYADDEAVRAAADREFLMGGGLNQEERAVSVLMLRKAWPTLSPLQRASVECWLLGTSATDTARRLGTTMKSLVSSRKAALERIAHPEAFGRAAWRPRDAESRRAQACARQARYRKRKAAAS